MVFIKQIYTQTAQYKYLQTELLDFLENNMALQKDRRMSLFFKSLRKNTSIKNRYSCLNSEYFQANSCLQTLSTGERQKLYEKGSDELILALLKQVNLNNQVQNLITVSCTGYQTPGLDFSLIKYLNLNQNIFRYNIGAMGCYAGITALRLASNLPQNTLLLCLELCSLHFQSEPISFSSLTSNALFGDGTALVELNQTEGEFELVSFASSYLANTLDKMHWLLRDTGFIMHLDSSVPALIEANLKTALEEFLQKQNLNISEIDYWAIHPGGLGILQAVQKSLNLPNNALEFSLSVLEEYGNMSSGTVFFVLNKIKQNNNLKKNNTIILLAFGPGLTIEMALLQKT